VTTPRALSPAYRLAIGIARPPLMIFTVRDWRGVEHLLRVWAGPPVDLSRFGGTPRPDAATLRAATAAIRWDPREHGQARTGNWRRRPRRRPGDGRGSAA